MAKNLYDTFYNYTGYEYWVEAMNDFVREQCEVETKHLVQVEHAGCVKFMGRLFEALTLRFPQETESTVAHLGCLYPSHMLMAASLPAFGVVSIDYLVETYRAFVEDADVVHMQYGGYNADNLLQLVIGVNHVTSNYPSIVVLLKIALTMAHGSVDCERAISLQNLIKSKSRNGLSVEHLEELMTCSRDGPTLAEIDAARQTRTWTCVIDAT
ncbi:hypothetical protein ACHHYP_13517 [Achlya hypogyna]|uniref:Uncharacterized protein n=1 Tax=Achlya hypogyna TaxID=1202772 RepID=A0A1V9YF60_ACHHY|nr:hypothetical protein ACHHYP_13517 [Achlya hypogyna]